MKKVLLVFLFIPLVSFGQSLRGININSYKYIVIDELIGKNSGEIRRFYVKNLKKAGYNVVNLSDPLKTHEEKPKEITEDPSLALFLVAEQIIDGCYTIISNLIDSNNNLILKEQTKLLSLSMQLKIYLWFENL